MRIEDQLQNLARQMESTQEPVSVDTIVRRRTERRLIETERPDRSRTRRFAVAAAIVLVLAGVGALALQASRPEPIVPTNTTTPPTTPDTEVTTPATVATTTIAEDGASGGGDERTNEPTLAYRGDGSWPMPTELPGGWEYGYATDFDGVRSARFVNTADGATIDVTIGRDSDSFDGATAEGSTTEPIGGELWTVTNVDDDVRLSRDIEGDLVEIEGPGEPARLVAGRLALVPETELARPPFRDEEPGVVVSVVEGDTPFEVRAHTDGLYTTVGGEIKHVSADDPLAFGDYQYRPAEGEASTPVLVSGVALPGLEQISFGLLDGDSIEVEPIDSDRFVEDFFAFVIDVPANVLTAYESGEIERLTRWTLTFVDGEQRVYDEPGAQNCVNCADGSATVQEAPTAEPQLLTGPFVDEPTNTYREDETWWVPAELPDGYEYLWSEEYLNGERELYFIAAAALQSPNLDPRGDPDAINIWVQPDAAAIERWQTSLESGDLEQTDVDGETWLLASQWFGAELSRVIDGELVTVGAGSTDIAIDVARQLARRPETELPRAPYRFDTNVVVATLPSDPGDGRGPIELRAASDGLTMVVDGQGPSLPIDAPLSFMLSTTRPPDQGGLTTISAVTSPQVATVEFVQLDGEVVTVEPTDLSGRFGVGFILVAIDVPGVARLGVDGVPLVVSQLESLVARDADGNVLQIESEPF